MTSVEPYEEEDKKIADLVEYCNNLGPDATLPKHLAGLLERTYVEKCITYQALGLTIQAFFDGSPDLANQFQKTFADVCSDIKSKIDTFVDDNSADT